jgi:pimeloyl-ACP methyl ester carboxylesterase
VATFVLVHGGWSGAHVFRRVRPPLLAAGHQVFTPALTGIGERAHLVSPQVNLTTHIRDVAGVVLYEDLDDIVLLGFSYGGFVVSGALRHIGDRVRQLVFLDAFVPNDLDSVFGLSGGSDDPAIEIGQPWLVPSTSREYEDPAEAAFHDVRRTPHPVGCFTERVRLSKPLEDYAFGRVYVKATASPANDPGEAVFRATAARCQSSPAWSYREIASNHMVPVNRPQELADLLLDLV